MTVSHAHARNACAHEQSTNIESGAVQWHKQSEQRATFATNLSQSRPFATNGKPIRSVLINGMCNFEDGIGAARRRPYRASDLT